MHFASIAAVAVVAAVAIAIAIAFSSTFTRVVIFAIATTTSTLAEPCRGVDGLFHDCRRNNNSIVCYY